MNTSRKISLRASVAAVTFGLSLSFGGLVLGAAPAAAASYTLSGHNLTVARQIQGTGATGGGTVRFDAATATLTASPARGFVFANWAAPGAYLLTAAGLPLDGYQGASVTVAASGHATVTAVFAPDNLGLGVGSITAAAGTGGTSATVPGPHVTTVMATPHACHVFERWEFNQAVEFVHGTSAASVTASVATPATAVVATPVFTALTTGACAPGGLAPVAPAPVTPVPEPAPAPVVPEPAPAPLPAPAPAPVVVTPAPVVPAPPAVPLGPDTVTPPAPTETPAADAVDAAGEGDGLGDEGIGAGGVGDEESEADGVDAEPTDAPPLAIAGGDGDDTPAPPLAIAGGNHDEPAGRGVNPWWAAVAVAALGAVAAGATALRRRLAP